MPAPVAGTAQGGAGRGGPVTNLRAGHVDADGRRVGRVLVAVALVALAASCAALFVSGAHRNAQIDHLRHDGVPVEMTVNGCLGQLGGSGSNAAGYACSGSFVLQGRRWNEAIPGSTLYQPGTKLHAVAVPGDPALVTLPSMLAGEHTSAKVFVLPSCLAVLLAAALALVSLRWRRSARRSPGQPHAGHEAGSR